MNQHVALANVDPRDVLLRYLSDESTESIAKDYNVTRQGLGKFLLKHAEQDWKDAQVARAIGRKEKAEDDLDKITQEMMADGSDAPKMLREDAQMMTAKLRAAEIRLKAAQWDLERVCKRIYGTEQQSNQSPVVINIGIKRGVTINQDEVTIEQKAEQSV